LRNLTDLSILALPKFGIQEYMLHTAETDAVFPHAYHFANGMLHQGNEPGMGAVALDHNRTAR
jgi:mannonate dehydratase